MKGEERAIDKMEKLTEKIEKASIDIALQVSNQGEQLSSISQTAKQLHNETSKTEHYAKQISSFWYFVRNKAKSGFSYIARRKQSDKEEKAQQVQSSAQPKSSNTEATKFSAEQTQNPRSVSVDQRLEAMTQKIKRVNQISRNTGEEIAQQNKEIQNIYANVDKSSKAVSEASSKLNRKMN